MYKGLSAGINYRCNYQLLPCLTMSTCLNTAGFVDWIPQDSPSHWATYSAVGEDGWFPFSVQPSNIFWFNMEVAKLGLYTGWLVPQCLAVGFDKWLCMCHHHFLRAINEFHKNTSVDAVSLPNLFFFFTLSYFIFRVIKKTSFKGRGVEVCLFVYLFSIPFPLRKAITIKFPIIAYF